MRVKVEKEVFVEAEIVVSIDDLLAELEERARLAAGIGPDEKLLGDQSPLTRSYQIHWGPIIGAATKMLARVPDEAMRAFNEACHRTVIDHLHAELKRWELARYEAGRRARPDEVRQIADKLKELGLGSADRLAWQLVRADVSAESIEAVIRFWREFAKERSVGALHRRLSFLARGKCAEQLFYEAACGPKANQAFNTALNLWPKSVLNRRHPSDQAPADSESAAAN